jgi:hypothetical protein
MGYHVVPVIDSNVSFECTASILRNLPFDIKNRYKLTALFIVFFGSGLAAPFFVMWHQLLKK